MELVINGDTVAEPVTDALIAQSINSLTGDGDSFAILAKASETYMQTSGGPSYGFVLEYRNGSESEHYSCSNFELTADEVIWAFRSYFVDDGEWETKLEWQPQVFDYSQGSTGINYGYGLVVVAVAALLIWKLFLSN